MTGSFAEEGKTMLMSGSAVWQAGLEPKGRTPKAQSKTQKQLYW